MGNASGLLGGGGSDAALLLTPQGGRAMLSSQYRPPAAPNRRPPAPPHNHALRLDDEERVRVLTSSIWCLPSHDWTVTHHPYFALLPAVVTRGWVWSVGVWAWAVAV